MSGSSYYVEPALYDTIYGDVTNDVAPHVASMRAADGPALEVCCGNGRLLIPTLEAGVECEGLDVDPAMLADLRAKLAARALAATLYEADMRTFDLPRRYALVAIRFNSFLHNLTQADQLATLAACRRHLRPGGRLELTVFHPGAAKLVELAAGEQLAKEVQAGPRRVRLYDRAEDDRVEQVRRVFRRIEIAEDGRLVTERATEFVLRYVFKPEMELLLRVAGFARWAVQALGAGVRDAATGSAAGPLQEGDILTWTAWND